MKEYPSGPVIEFTPDHDMIQRLPRGKRNRPPSKYRPHQGSREIERRRKRMAKKAAKAERQASAALGHDMDRIIKAGKP